MIKYIKYIFRVIVYFPADFLYYLLSYRKKYGISFGGYNLSKQYPNYLSSHNAKRGIESYALKLINGKALDIGAGSSPLDGARGIDNSVEENAYNIQENNQSVDFVFSSHCLEHLEFPKKCLHEIWRVLKSDGLLLLYLPHPACELWSKRVNEHHISFFWPNQWEDILIDEGFTIKDITYQPDGMMSFFILASKK
jgi:SAM-dependent methyltransferase